MSPRSTINVPPGLRGRIAALTPRERRFLVAGALALLAFLAYLLWASGDPEPAEPAPEAVELVAAPPPVAPPAPIVSAPIAAPPPPQAAPGAAPGIGLRGVMGGGNSGGAAIFGMADGSQRVVRVGREIVPGLTLRQVGVHYAIASSPSGELRFQLNGAGGIMAAPAPPAWASPATAPAGPVPGLNR
jgi:hypothetical protein